MVASSKGPAWQSLQSQIDALLWPEQTPLACRQLMLQLRELLWMLCDCYLGHIAADDVHC